MTGKKQCSDFDFWFFKHVQQSVYICFLPNSFPYYVLQFGFHLLIYIDNLSLFFRFFRSGVQKAGSDIKWVMV